MTAEFNRQANRSFIGSPTINILDGSIQGREFVSECGLIKMQIGEKDMDKLKAYDKKAIKLGIRSERFLAGEAPDSFKATVDVIEMLGKEKTLYVKTESGVELTLTFPGHFQYGQGEVHQFGLDPKAVHYFDAETGESVIDRRLDG
jgi:multiple sugar transport system ATP-binding protein